MKTKKQIWLLLFAFITGNMYAQYQANSPSWAKDLIIYELSPKSYTSPEGPETGTFNSVKEKIPYLQELGINAVWFTGHNWADPKHFYNIWTQYAAIRPDSLDHTLGTPADFKSMVDEFHRHGIKVFLDVITHGVMKYSPLVSEHPEWFKGESWGMADYDWAGKHPDLDDWWVKTHTDYVTEYGVDGYRLDLRIYRPDLWNKIKQNAARAGHPIVVFVEGLGYKEAYTEGVADFYQRITRLAAQEGGLVKGMKLIDNVASYYEKPDPKMLDSVLNTCILSCHDEGWEGFNDDENPYVAEGSRCVFGYSCMFTPAIPIFMGGEEFDAGYRPLPMLSYHLYDKKRIGQGKWLYGSWIQWEQLNGKRHQEMLADVKKMIAIRKQEKDVIHSVHSDTTPRIDKVQYKSSSPVPVPYILWNDRKAILVAGNNTDRNVKLTVTLPLGKTGMATAGASQVRITDLWNGGEKILSLNKTSDFSFTIRKDRVAGGGLAVYKIEVIR